MVRRRRIQETYGLERLILAGPSTIPGVMGSWNLDAKDELDILTTYI